MGITRRNLDNLSHQADQLRSSLSWELGRERCNEVVARCQAQSGGSWAKFVDLLYSALQSARALREDSP